MKMKKLLKFFFLILMVFIKLTLALVKKEGALIFSPYNSYLDPIFIQKEKSFYIKGDIGLTFVIRNDMTSFPFFTFYYNPFFVKVEHFFDNIEKNYFLKRLSFAYNFVIQIVFNNLNSYNKSFFYTNANGLYPIKRKNES